MHENACQVKEYQGPKCMHFVITCQVRSSDAFIYSARSRALSSSEEQRGAAIIGGAPAAAAVLARPRVSNIGRNIMRVPRCCCPCMVPLFTSSPAVVRPRSQLMTIQQRVEHAKQLGGIAITGAFHRTRADPHQPGQKGEIWKSSKVVH